MDLEKQIEKIKDGYTVIEDEEDGHDEFGSLYWVWCKNGWSGRSWELDSNLKTDIKNAENEYYKKINSITTTKKTTKTTTKTTSNTNISSTKCKFDTEKKGEI